MLQQKETIGIRDIHLCSKQDLDDIQSLLIAIHALIILVKRKRISSSVAAWTMHAIGIANGLWAIKETFNDNTKIFALLYIPLMIYCAKNGFEANEISNNAKTDLIDLQDKYNSLKTILTQVNPAQIHDIAKIYRREIPKNEENDITPDAIQKAIKYILIRYER